MIPQRPWYTNKKKAASWLHRRHNVVLLVVLFAAFCALVGICYAKYVHQDSGDGYLRAQVFYFTSDLLDGETHTLSSSTESVTFTLGNHADKLRYSEVDIAYTVTVTGNAELSATSGTLLSGAVKDDTITLSGLESGKTYTVTAVGTGGYHKTLTATFVVQADPAQLYYYVDTSNSAYVLLTVWSQGYAGDVTINFPGVLAPDNTDPLMERVKSADGSFTDESTFTGDGYQSHAYRFFGSGVTASDFTITYGGNTATVKTPS